MTETFVGSQHYSVQVASLDQEQQGLLSSSGSGILQSRLKEHIRNADKQYSTFLKGSMGRLGSTRSEPSISSHRSTRRTR